MTPLSNHQFVFVYGSLKKGYSNSDLLLNEKYLGEFETLDKFSMVSLGTFPGVFLSGKASTIKGELYKVSEDCMLRLDELEGYHGDENSLHSSIQGNEEAFPSLTPSFYDRVQIQISNPSGDISIAWIYYLPNEMDYLDFKPIPSGNWVENSYPFNFST